MSELVPEKFAYGTDEPHHGTEPLLEPDWTQDEEKRAKRKVDLVLMPLLMLGFFCLQLDRGNISNAITDNFRPDVGISQNQFNVGQQLLSTGIVLLELPANILLYRLGPSIWLSCQVVAFGLVSTFQAFQSNYAGFLVTRLLLGLTESGYIPGALYTLTTWYTRKETAKRVSIFFVGNMAASASSNLIAYGILHMRGFGGKPGWFWLFVLMGLFTILSGIILALLLPTSVDKPHSWLFPKLRFFTARELHILRYRVLLDDPKKGHKRVRLSGKAIRSALSNWRLYPHVMITLLNNGPLTAFGTYVPTIINSFGFARLRSNALASVGGWAVIPVTVALSFISDRYNLRAATTIFASTLNLAYMIMNSQLATSKSRNKRYAGIVLTQSIAFTPHPLNVAWMALHTRNSEERAVAMAMIIMSANAAGIYGNQLFRADDSPLYRRGFKVNAGLLGGALGFGVFQAVQYWRTARKNGGIEDCQPEKPTPSNIASSSNSDAGTSDEEDLERKRVNV